jgi:hypothetical protein
LQLHSKCSSKEGCLCWSQSLISTVQGPGNSSLHF